MGSTAVLILFCAFIAAASVAGGLVPTLLKLTHRRLQFGLSFVSGVMLGVAFFHMLPHALMARTEAAEAAAAAGGAEADPHGLFDPLMLAVVLGFLAMFFLERFAHFHQHEPPEPACDDPMHGHEGHDAHHHGHSHGHGGEHLGHGGARAVPVGRLTWAGAAVGMGLHSLLEGVALAASIAAVRVADAGVSPALAGVGTFLVILLHKPFDSMTVATLLRAGGGTRAQVTIFNLLFALLVPVGVLLFEGGLALVGDSGPYVPYALAFSAGTFVCIAAADLLPEVQFHRHDRAGLSIALILGLGVAFGIGRLEAASHGHEHAAHGHADHVHADDGHADHDHAGHDHAGHDHAGHDYGRHPRHR